jgi:hypothetical protein
LSIPLKKLPGNGSRLKIPGYASASVQKLLSVSPRHSLTYMPRFQIKYQLALTHVGKNARKL